MDISVLDDNWGMCQMTGYTKGKKSLYNVVPSNTKLKPTTKNTKQHNYKTKKIQSNIITKENIPTQKTNTGSFDLKTVGEEEDNISRGILFQRKGAFM